ncbi:hypothetical protein LTR50_001440 [Elasticomyces elasticus]|nr:hypothetical protein LTR50_001440 [Elasticomyces elasticus]
MIGSAPPRRGSSTTCTTSVTDVEGESSPAANIPGAAQNTAGMQDNTGSQPSVAGKHEGRMRTKWTFCKVVNTIIALSMLMVAVYTLLFGIKTYNIDKAKHSPNKNNPNGLSARNDCWSACPVAPRPVPMGIIDNKHSPKSEAYITLIMLLTAVINSASCIKASVQIRRPSARQISTLTSSLVPVCASLYAVNLDSTFTIIPSHHFWIVDSIIVLVGSSPIAIEWSTHRLSYKMAYLGLLGVLFASAKAITSNARTQQAPSLAWNVAFNIITVALLVFSQYFQKHQKQDLWTSEQKKLV